MEDILYSWSGRLKIVKMVILPKVVCRFSTASLKILVAVFQKFMWKMQNNLEKEEKVWRNHIS
jgi:hypothetical protein